MNINITEIENLLRQELETCQNLDKYMDTKKEFLVAGDLTGIAQIDFEIEKCNFALEKLAEKRKYLNCPSEKLEELTKKYKNEPLAQKISEMKSSLDKLLNSISVKNTLNSELIRHSLKIVENYINSITKVLIPESCIYNNKGKIYKQQNNYSTGTIIHEA